MSSYENLDIDACDGMMIYDFVRDNYGETYKSLFRLVPMQKWRTELARMGVDNLPPKTLDEHKSYIGSKIDPELKQLIDENPIWHIVP